MKRASVKFLATMVVLLAAATSAWADFAAIAYSPSTGRWASTYGYSSRAEAENAAISRLNVDDARAVVWVQNGWAALAVGGDGSRGWGWSGSSLSEAKAIALRNASPGASVRCWTYSGQ